MIHVHVEAVRSINSAADVNKNVPVFHAFKIERGDSVVELDQYKGRLSAYESPLAEMRDSL